MSEIKIPDNKIISQVKSMVKQMQQFDYISTTDRVHNRTSIN